MKNLLALIILTVVVADGVEQCGYVMDSQILSYNAASINACAEQHGVPIYAPANTPTGTGYMKLTQCSLPPASPLPERR